MRSGVTLLELLAAMMIVAILMAVALPRMVSTGEMSQMRGAVREMVALARYARQTAILGEVEVEMRFAPQVGRFELEYDPVEIELLRRLDERRRGRGRQRVTRRDEENVLRSHIQWLRPRDLPVDRVGQPVVVFAAVETALETESQQGRRHSLPTIVFYPDGTTSGGRIVLESRRGGHMTIDVQVATGMPVVSAGDARERDEEGTT
jgi:prepilin-type N-terminal cleavage/methylation domain-containing protein